MLLSILPVVGNDEERNRKVQQIKPGIRVWYHLQNFGIFDNELLHMTSSAGDRLGTPVSKVENYLHLGINRALGKKSELDLKGKRDKTRLAKDLERITPIFEGLCARAILWSALLVEVGDEDPCNSKDTSTVHILEIRGTPENGLRN